MWVYIAGAFALLIPVIWLPREAMFEISDSIIVATAIGLAVSFAPDMWNALKLPFHRIEPGQAYIISLFMKSIGVALIAAGLWYWRFMGRPNWMESSTFWLASRYLTAAAMILALAVNWTHVGTIEARALGKLSMLIAVAVTFALSIIIVAAGSRP